MIQLGLMPVGLAVAVRVADQLPFIGADTANVGRVAIGDSDADNWLAAMSPNTINRARTQGEFPRDIGRLLSCVSVRNSPRQIRVLRAIRVC